MSSLYSHLPFFSSFYFSFYFQHIYHRATSISKTIGSLCDKLKVTYPCPGCSKQFCFDDLNNHDLIRQQVDDIKTDPMKHPSIEQIDRSEKDSISKIKEKAQHCRARWIQYSTSFLQQKEKKLNDLPKQIKGIHQENEFSELDLNRIKGNLQKLEKQLKQPPLCSVSDHQLHSSTTFLFLSQPKKVKINENFLIGR